MYANKLYWLLLDCPVCGVPGGIIYSLQHNPGSVHIRPDVHPVSAIVLDVQMKLTIYMQLVLPDLAPSPVTQLLLSDTLSSLTSYILLIDLSTGNNGKFPLPNTGICQLYIAQCLVLGSTSLMVLG